MANDSKLTPSIMTPSSRLLNPKPSSDPVKMSAAQKHDQDLHRPYDVQHAGRGANEQPRLACDVRRPDTKMPMNTRTMPSPNKVARPPRAAFGTYHTLRKPIFVAYSHCIEICRAPGWPIGRAARPFPPTGRAGSIRGARAQQHEPEDWTVGRAKGVQVMRVICCGVWV